jgi:hypothetical protein
VEQHVLDDRLDRREAGAPGDEDHRLVGVLAQVEAAERALEAQDLAPVIAREQRVGEQPARRVPDVELEQSIGVRRGRDREASPMPVLQQEVDVLAGQVLQAFARRQLQPHDGDVGGGLVDRLDPAGQPLDRDVSRTPHFAGLDDEVAPRARAAEERVALPLLVVGQGGRLARAVVDAALDDLALARSARAVAAAVGNHQVGAHRRLQHRLIGLAGERVAAGACGNLERHRRMGVAAA